MSTRERQMEGTANFYTFAYLWQAVLNAAEAAKSSKQGSNYHRISAVLFSAFTIEAHLNHIGEIRLPFWPIVERKLAWRDKLGLIAQHLGLEIDDSRRPFQTLVEIFRFRDKLAHGKSQTDNYSYTYKGDDQDEFACMDPDWLRKFWSDDAVKRVMEDTERILETFQEKAGLRKDSIYLMGDGAFEERQDAKPQDQGQSRYKSG